MPVILLLLLSIIAFTLTIYMSILPATPESIGLWIAISILYLYIYFAEKYDAIILNGALIGLYLAYTTI